MSDRYQGGVIRATPLAPTSSSASGIWTMEQQAKAQAAGDWPAAPLTVDPNFNQTSLLLTGEPAGGLDYTTFSDASTNNFLPTIVGPAYGTAFSPYNSTFSNYFDGSGDYLTVADNAALDLGSGDFTIEFWYQAPNGFTSNDALVTKGNSSGLAPWTIIYDGGGLYFYASSNGGAWDVISEGTFISSGVLANKQWNHVAVTREGTSFRFFFNGSLTQTKTSSGTILDTSDPLSIGANINGSNDSNVYISNLRIVKGTAVYTSAFTPPTAPLTAISGTSLLTCQSNRFIDNSANAFAITVNGNTAISGFIPFTDTDTTTGSGYFYKPGSPCGLSLAANSAFVYGTGNFTIEFWMYTTLFNTYQEIFDMRGDSSPGVTLYLDHTDNNIRFYNGSDAINGSAGEIKVNRWYHIALVRESAVTKLYVNGTQTGSSYSDSNSYGSNPVYIGKHYSSDSYNFNGYLADLRVVKGTAVYTSNFTPPTAPVSAVSGTSLLTLQDRAANQNIGFIDTSKRQTFTSTSGSPTQGTFSPFSQADGYWSTYFDGAADSNANYITAPNSSGLNFGTGDFSIELWINTSVTKPYMFICNQYYGPNEWYGWNLGLEANGLYPEFGVFGGSSGLSAFVTGTTAINDGAWHHVAVVRTGTTLSMFVDGAREDTETNSYNISATSAFIAAVQSGNARDWTGYMSNLRIIKGTTPYDATQTTITVPTSPLTAVSNTQFLVFQSNRFIDNSANALTLTQYGTTSVQSFGPFAPADAYDPAVNGGSLYLDGSSYITTSNMGGFGTGDFTVEAWVYSPWIYSGSGLAVPIFIAGTGGEFAFGFYQDALYYGTSETANILYYNVGNQRNNWMHVAVTRSSGTTNLYYNGVRVGTTSNSEDWAADNYWIGRRGNGSTGLAYITDLRVLKGTALYTGATYTIPTAPLTVVSGTELLCNFTNAGILDSAARTNLVTVTPYQITTSISKFGSGSYAAPFSNGGIVSASSVDIAVGQGDFTVEGWIYITTITSSYQGLMDTRSNGTSATGFFVGTNPSGYPVFYTNSAERITGSTALSENTWYHLAAVRSSGSTKLYVNGTQVGSTYTDAGDYSNKTLVVGSNFSLAIPLDGYIDDFRYTKGVARYTSNFTPADYPFPVK